MKEKEKEKEKLSPTKEEITRSLVSAC